MRNKSQVLFFLFILLTFCQGQKSSVEEYLIKTLEVAENAKDLGGIQLIFDENATLYTTDLMPVQDAKAISNLYEFVFSRNDIKKVTYLVDSSYRIIDQIFEIGNLITEKTNQNKITQPFKAIFERNNNHYRITEISFGVEADLIKELPKLMEPTGNYHIGQTTFFYDKNNSGNSRMLSFQVWYPSLADTKDKLPFRSEEVILNASNFLGIPLFTTSHFSKIESHSIWNAPAIKDKRFPVLIYNHGYGGFTQVYQTVFEDLVSHGYIVVSIGHENESALLIQDNGAVVSNSPQNEFFAKRSRELSGVEIGRWQSTILSSDNYAENEKAYREMLRLTPLHNESVRLWETDTKATLKKLERINHEDKNLTGVFDLENMGIFGHSLGGATAGQMCVSNSVFKVGINLDGFQFGDLYDDELQVPFMFVTSNPEGNRYLRALTFIAESKEDGYQVSIEGFAHDNFTDLKYITEGDTMAMELQRALVRSFFDKYLKYKTLDWNELMNTYNQIRLTASNVIE